MNAAGDGQRRQPTVRTLSASEKTAWSRIEDDGPGIRPIIT